MFEKTEKSADQIAMEKEFAQKMVKELISFSEANITRAIEMLHNIRNVLAVETEEQIARHKKHLEEGQMRLEQLHEGLKSIS